MKSVKFIPNTPFAFSYGGFEIQTQSTLNAVVKAGVNASLIDFYSKDKSFDIVHLWGASHTSAKLATLAKKAGKKVIITALLSYFENFKEIAEYKLGDLIRKNEYLKSLAKNTDAFIVVNEAQRKAAIKYYYINAGKIAIIPNVVDDVFFEINDYKKNNYVLCSGNICRRKNQLNLVKACIKANTELILLGNVLDGEQQYAAEIEKLIAKNNKIQWIKGVEHGGEEMMALYRNASLVALPSFVEQQPISLLEGAAMHIPILCAQKAYGQQEYYQNAKLVVPQSVSSIAEGIKAVFNSPDKYIVPNEMARKCGTTTIGNAYKTIYETLF